MQRYSIIFLTWRFRNMIREKNRLGLLKLKNPDPPSRRRRKSTHTQVPHRRSIPLRRHEISARLGFMPPPAQKTTRYIPAALKRGVWNRDQGRCTNCGSRAQLEYDHVVAFALGGATELDNLRLLCRACNAAAAIKVFGLTHRGRARASGGQVDLCTNCLITGCHCRALPF